MKRRATIEGSQRPLLGLALLAAMVSVPATIWVPTAQAQVQSEHAFAIPALPLSEALALFGNQSGYQVTADADALRGVQGHAVNGALLAVNALSQLLEGTGFTFRISGNAVIIERAPQLGSEAIKLGPVRIEGQTSTAEANGSSDPTVTEGTHSYASAAVTVGGKTARDFTQVQQSVSVVTQQRIRDQAMLNVKDALNYTAGLNVVSGANAQANIYSRGFAITNFQFDGGAPSLYNTNYDRMSLPDLAIYDHVEVLPGADGLFCGPGEAGVTVNLVRKHSLDHFQYTTDTSIGSWDHYRQQFDVTGPLNAAGTLRGRLVALQDNQHY